MIDRDTFDAEQLARMWQATYRRIAEEIGYLPDILPWKDLPDRHRHLLIATAAEVLNDLDQAALLTVSRPRMGWWPR